MTVHMNIWEVHLIILISNLMHTKFHYQFTIYQIPININFRWLHQPPLNSIIKCDQCSHLILNILVSYKRSIHTTDL